MTVDVKTEYEDSIEFTLEQAETLVEMFGGEKDSSVTVTLTIGHSGEGLYAYESEYPGEGSTYLGPSGGGDVEVQEEAPNGHP